MGENIKYTQRASRNLCAAHERTRYTIIPMQVEGLLVFEGDKTEYALLNPNFNSLKMYPSGKAIETAPFTMKLQKEEPGIHIHWLLPEEAAHGIQETASDMQNADSDKIVYPPIPTRYLVTRLAVLYTGGASRTEKKTWIVESNSLAKKRTAQNQGSAAIPSENDLQMTYRLLGESREFLGEITEGLWHQEELNVCVNGSPYYAAFYPQCRNVLGFYDTLEDLEDAVKNGNMAEISYVVTAWHEKEDEQFADHIYHGLLSGIQWKGRRTRYPSGIPELDNIVKISVGSSSAQAMAALAAFHQGNQLTERMVEGLMENSLQDWSRLDGFLEAEYRMHENSFSTMQALRLADVRRIEGSAETPGDEGQGFNVKLAAIRECQRNLMEQVLERNQLQQELTDIWREYLLKSDPKTLRNETLQNEILQKAKLEVSKRIQQLNENGQSCVRIQSDLQKRLDELKEQAKEQLEEESCVDQRFYIGNNPVVMLEGAGKNSVLDTGSWGEEKRQRRPEEIVRQKGGVTADELLQPLFPVNLSQIPEQATQHNKDVLDIAQALIGEVLLDKHMFYVSSYKPSWIPLILEWEAEFYPDEELLKEAFTLKNWSLEGIDFVYQKEKPDLDKKEVYSGRITLTSHASEILKDASENFIKVQEGVYAVKELPYQVLSQALTGFREELVMRKQAIQYPVKAFSDKDMELAKMVEPWVDGADTLSADHSNGFYLISAGFLRFIRFHVIDTFGRVQAFQPAAIIVPEKYQTVREKMNTYVVMPPRLMQPSRIFFQWRDVKSDAPCIDLKETSPICGWLWPNFAEASLLVYSPEGTMLGFLQSIYDLETGEAQPVWRNAPGENYLRQGYPEDMPQDMRNLLDGILACGEKDSSIITGILKMLDECFWNIHCDDMQEADSTYAVLGHPIAVVRAGIALQLQGNMIKPPTVLFEEDEVSYARLEETRFPIRFGNPRQKGDGVIGFFDLDEESPFERLHVCGIDKNKCSANNGYLEYDPTVSLKLSLNGEEKKMIFLASPYGKIHIISGLLPVKAVRLPREQVSRALEKIFYTLFCAPVLTPSDCFTMPYPHVEDRHWSYLKRNFQGIWEEVTDIRIAGDKAFSQMSACELQEGWLKQNLKQTENKKEEEEGDHGRGKQP